MANGQVITGLTGSVTLPGSESFLVSSVTLRTGPVLLDTTSFGQLYRTRVAGVQDLGGSVVIFATSGTGANGSPFQLANGVPGVMTVNYSPINNITFTSVFGNVQIASQAEGLALITADFSNTGTVVPSGTWL